MTSCFRAVQQLGTREGANGMFELSHTEQHKRRPPYVPNTAYASFGLAVPVACYRRELASCVASPSYAVIAALLHIRHCLLRIFGNTSVSTLWPYGDREPGIWAARGMQSRNIALCSSICLLSKHRRASRSHIARAAFGRAEHFLSMPVVIQFLVPIIDCIPVLPCSQHFCCKLHTHVHTPAACLPHKAHQQTTSSNEQT